MLAKISSTKFLVVFALVLVLILVPFFTKDTYLLGVLIFIFIAIILAATFRTVMNMGYMNIAHVSFMGVGAYTSGLLATKLGLNFWICFPAAGLMAGILGLGIGYATLRMKGFYFVMMSTALVEALRMFVMNTPHNWAGGARGLVNIPIPDPIVIPGVLSIGFDSRINFYYLVMVAMVVFLAALYSIEKSRVGLILNAIKESDQLVQHVGINIMRYKVVAFVFAMTIVGLTGSLYAHFYSLIGPPELGFMGTAWSIIHCVIGGWGSIAGPIIGATIISSLSEFLRTFKQYMPIPLGIIMILMLLFTPEGIIGLPSRISRWVRKKA